MDIYLQWVVDVWNSISTDVIKKSFKCCGVSIATDGSEDHLVHVFGDKGACPEGMAILNEKRKVYDSNPELTLDPNCAYDSDCTVD